MLERLTADDFKPAIGERFRTTAADAPVLELELTEVKLQNPDAPAADADGVRAPFSLTFVGPVEPQLPQRIYRLEHESLGPLEIFIVPVASSESGISYQ